MKELEPGNPNKNSHSLRDAALTAGKIVALGVAFGMASGAGVTIENHRKKTHRSLETSKLLEEAIAAEQASHGVWDSSVWASVHRIHHSFTDISAKPFLDIHNAVKWAQDNPDKIGSSAIPESFPNLDPYVDAFSLADVMHVGRLAEEELKERMGVSYKRPDSYTPETLNEILRPEKPSYYYKSTSKKNGEDYAQDEIAERLLGDPHSPIRVPPPEENAVRGIAKKNVAYYSDVAKMFTQRPDLKPKDLQSENGKNREPRPWLIAAGVLLPSVAVLLKRGTFEPKDFVKAGIIGTALYAGKVAFVIVGGNITNAFGHAGYLTDKDIVNAVGRRKFKPTLNADGSLTTDTKYSGLPGRLLSTLTLDEVGGQQVHHAYPEKIAYTTNTGVKGFTDAPFGTIVEKLAQSKWFPFIKEGKGFDLKPGETRPDMPHPIVDIIQKARVAQMEQNKQ